MDVYDARGKRTGRVDHDGTVYNASGKYMGRVDHDGLVFNSYNSFVGQVQDNGLVSLTNGEIMAWVDDEGAMCIRSGEQRMNVSLAWDRYRLVITRAGLNRDAGDKIVREDSARHKFAHHGVKRRERLVRHDPAMIFQQP